MASASPLLAASLHLIACPVCYSRLQLAGDSLDCTGCRRRYPIVEGRPVLIVDRATLPPHAS